MKGIFLLLVLTTVAYGQECAKQIKDFQICVESWAANERPEPPEFPEFPFGDMQEIAAKTAACFTDNKCEDPIAEMMEHFLKEGSSSSEEGGPPFGGPPRGPPPEMLSKILEKFSCMRNLMQKHFKPDLETCVQERIPGWTCPEPPPENDTRPFDPFGEGPMGCPKLHMYNMARKMKQEGKLRQKRGGFGRHHGPPFGGPPPFGRGPPPFGGLPPPFMRGPPFMGGKPPGMMRMKMKMKKMMAKIAGKVYDTDTCPVDARETVSQCLVDLSAELRTEMCSKKPNKMEMLLDMTKAHDKFCDNRQKCYDKISEECRKDFWDQKWFAARCFTQIARTFDDDKWEEVGNDLKECMDEVFESSSSGESEEEDEEEEEEASAESQSSSSEERKKGCKGRKLFWMLKKKFMKPEIQDPCLKKNGVYKFIIYGPGGPHGPRGRGGPHHGPPGRGHHGPPHHRGRGRGGRFRGRRPPF